MPEVNQMYGSHLKPDSNWCYAESLKYRRRLYYVLQKCLWKQGRSVVIPIASLIVIMLDRCNFRELPRQWLCKSYGNARFSWFSSTGYNDISLQPARNVQTGFQSHCQSLNLCLRIAERLSECEWASRQRSCPWSVFTYTWPFSGLTCLHGQ